MMVDGCQNCLKSDFANYMVSALKYSSHRVSNDRIESTREAVDVSFAELAQRVVSVRIPLHATGTDRIQIKCDQTQIAKHIGATRPF